MKNNEQNNIFGKNIKAIRLFQVLKKEKLKIAFVKKVVFLYQCLKKLN